MLGGLLNDALPQPVDECLATIGRLLRGGKKYPPVIAPRWIPPLGVRSNAAQTEVILQIWERFIAYLISQTISYQKCCIATWKSCLGSTMYTIAVIENYFIGLRSILIIHGFKDYPWLQ